MLVKLIIQKNACGLNAAGQGDFTQQVTIDSSDEIGQLIISFQTMKNNLKSLIDNVIHTSKEATTKKAIKTINSDQTSKATEQITKLFKK
ncbi:HAMP domain-containing protein [Anaerobacillus sp. HL2]|nr:HAMP domain-containing protein [Anaerobacillus sp. HL2]